MQVYLKNFKEAEDFIDRHWAPHRQQEEKPKKKNKKKAEAVSKEKEGKKKVKIAKEEGEQEKEESVIQVKEHQRHSKLGNEHKVTEHTRSPVASNVEPKRQDNSGAEAQNNQ